MIIKANSQKLQREAVVAARPTLTVMERGMLTWAVLDPGDKVLDMNSTGGLMLEYLTRHLECEICGMSVSMENVRRARTKLRNADIVYANPEDIPWLENSFDTVFLCKSKQDNERLETVLSEILRVLKPGGQFLLGVRSYPAPLRQLIHLAFPDEGDMELPAGQSKAEWIKALEQAGYEEVTWQRVSLASGITIGWKPLGRDLLA